jgi:hypothetical protein
MSSPKRPANLSEMTEIKPRGPKEFPTGDYFGIIEFREDCSTIVVTFTNQSEWADKVETFLKDGCNFHAYSATSAHIEIKVTIPR